jgi:hypothetical protein
MSGSTSSGRAPNCETDVMGQEETSCDTSHDRGRSPLDRSARRRVKERMLNPIEQSSAPPDRRDDQRSRIGPQSLWRNDEAAVLPKSIALLGLELPIEIALDIHLLRGQIANGAQLTMGFEDLCDPLTRPRLGQQHRTKQSVKYGMSKKAGFLKHVMLSL